jgi:hypothetical protein
MDSKGHIADTADYRYEWRNTATHLVERTYNGRSANLTVQFENEQVTPGNYSMHVTVYYTKGRDKPEYITEGRIQFTLTGEYITSRRGEFSLH